jgi:hypothetical protein
MRKFASITAMENTYTPAIVRLVKHHGGTVKLSRKMGGKPVYQEIQRWVRRGYVAPVHLFALKPFLPRGIKLSDLHQDKVRALAEADA